MSEEFITLNSKYLFKRPWMTVRLDQIQLPNGNIVPEYYVLEYPDWLTVIAITTEGEMILEHQYRYGLRCMSWELPCGVMEQTDASPMAGAQRELLEETGFGGGQWSEFDVVSANPGTHSNLTHCFLAQGVEKISEPHLDEGEYLHVHLFSKEQVLEKLKKGDFIQAIHATSLWKYFYNS